MAQAGTIKIGLGTGMKIGHVFGDPQGVFLIGRMPIGSSINLYNGSVEVPTAFGNVVYRRGPDGLWNQEQKCLVASQ